MRNLRAHGCARLASLNRATRSYRFIRRFVFLRAWVFWMALLLALAGCGAPAHVSLTGPGLHRAIAQGAQGALRFWWLPPTAQNPIPRLLLWDGTNVGIANPAATNQSFTSLESANTCNQVAIAPDEHAFACGQNGTVLIQSLENQDAQPQPLADETAPLAWAPGSNWLAALHLGYTDGSPSCSVVAVNTSLPNGGESSEQVLLDGIPFTDATSSNSGICPVMAMAWSPDGTRLALSLTSSDGVVLEVLAMSAPGQPAMIESRHVLPGKALQLFDTPATPSLFWSSDGRTLAAITGYGMISEDGLYLLFVDQQTTLTGPNLFDGGFGAALAFSPDGHWLAVGAIGPHQNADNAQLRVFNTQDNRWDTLNSMLANGNSLAWSPNGSLLAADSASQQGELILNWPSAKLNSIIPNQDSASLAQLGWAQDGSTLYFTLASQSDNPPYFDEVYAQQFPVPPGASSFAFPDWFLNALGSLPQTQIALGGALLVLIVFSLLLVLIERGRSRRRRALILWTPGVCSVLVALIFLTYNQLPGWMAAFYQPFSVRFCHDAPNPCNPAAALAMGIWSMPLLLGVLVILIGALLTSRKRRFVPGEGLPRPVSRGPMEPRPVQPEAPAEAEEPALLLPMPIDEQDTLELEALPVSAWQPLADESEELDS